MSCLTVGRQLGLGVLLAALTLAVPAAAKEKKKAEPEDPTGGLFDALGGGLEGSSSSLALK